jgi:hypothetical protein
MGETMAAAANQEKAFVAYEFTVDGIVYRDTWEGDWITSAMVSAVPPRLESRLRKGGAVELGALLAEASQMLATGEGSLDDVIEDMAVAVMADATGGATGGPETILEIALDAVDAIESNQEPERDFASQSFASSEPTGGFDVAEALEMVEGVEPGGVASLFDIAAGSGGIEDMVDQAVTEALDEVLQETVDDAVSGSMDDAVQGSVDEAVTEAIEEAMQDAKAGEAAAEEAAEEDWSFANPMISIRYNPNRPSHSIVESTAGAKSLAYMFGFGVIFLMTIGYFVLLYPQMKQLGY